MLRLRHLISEILARHTGQSYDRIEHDIERDLILTASQALEYGLIDVVQQSRAEADKEAKSVEVALAVA